MTGSDDIRRKADPRDQKAFDLMFSKHYLLTLRILCYAVGTLLLFAGGGYLLDSWLGTRAIFLVLGVIMSFVITQVLLYISFRKYF